ncbi:MAG: ester cyclase [Actinomycetota bacterium]|nr:ester cyclase [Actinomycetota bacterium]
MAETQTAGRTAREVAETAFDRFSAHDIEGCLAQWHPEGIQDWVALGVFRGHDEIREQFREVFTAVPDLEMVVENVTADDRRCVIQWRLRGTHTGGPLNGIEPTGRTVELRGVDVMEVEDGLIVRNTVYYDGAAYARAFGMLPPQDSSAERMMIGAFNGVTRLRRAIADYR